jgi:sugar phosphate isomerase/epimerase
MGIAAIHPRLSVHELSTVNLPFAEELGLWELLGVPSVGLMADKAPAYGWDRAVRALADRDIAISCLMPGERFNLHDPQTWPVTQSVIATTLDRAAALGVGRIYMTPGRAGGLPWEELRDRLVDAAAPCVAHARAVGVRLAFEVSSPVRTDVCFVHTLRDGVDVAAATGLDVVVDLSNIWMERGLAQTFERAAAHIALVQAGDFRIGTLESPGRCVPGDGDIPIATLLGQLLAVGYAGPIELEALGPAIEQEGYASSLRRGVERLSAVLVEIGA